MLHQDNNLEFICLSILVIYLLDRVSKLQGEFEKSLLGVKAGLRSFIRPFLQLQFGGNQIIFVWCKFHGGPGGYSWEFLVGGIPPGSPNPDLFQTKKCNFP